MDQKHKEFNSIVLTSPGIGKHYFKRTDHIRNRFAGYETKDNYKDQRGQTNALPIYYRNKIYSDEERERLWLIKLDKQIRYVNGVKIDVSTPEGEKQYFKALEHAHAKNKRLGFGTDRS